MEAPPALRQHVRQRIIGGMAAAYNARIKTYILREITRTGYGLKIKHFHLLL
jgi:hypothetical protein